MDGAAGGKGRKAGGKAKRRKEEKSGSRFTRGVFRSFETIEDWLRDPEWNSDAVLSEQEAREAFVKLKDCARAGKNWKLGGKNCQKEGEDYALDEEKLEMFLAESKKKELEKFRELDGRIQKAEEEFGKNLGPTFPGRLLSKKDEEVILRPFSPPDKADKDGTKTKQKQNANSFLIVPTGPISGLQTTGAESEIPLGQHLQQTSLEEKTSQSAVPTSQRFVIRRHGDLRLARVMYGVGEIQLTSYDGKQMERIPLLADQGEITCHEDLSRALRDSDAVARVLPKIAVSTRSSIQKLWKTIT